MKKVAELIEGNEHYLVYSHNNEYYKKNIKTDEIEKIVEEENSLYRKVSLINENILNQKVVSSRKVEKNHDLKRFLVTLALAGAVTLLTYKGIDNYREAKSEVMVFEDNDLERNLNDAILHNRSLNATTRKELYDYVHILFESEKTKEFYSLVIENIENAEFIGVDKLCEGDIGLLFKNHVNETFLAKELYNYYNNVTLSYDDPYQIKANLVSLMGDESIKEVFTKDVNKLIKKKLDIDLSADDLDEQQEALSYINENQRLLENFSTTEHLVSNVFAENLESYDSLYDYYNYYDRSSFKNISFTIYYAKLSTLIDKKLNLQDKKDRMLLYLLANAYCTENAEDLANANSDLTYFILKGGMSDRAPYDTLDIYRYLCGNDLDVSKACDLDYISIYLPYTFSLLKDVNTCLKIELIDGNISFDDYNVFYSVVMDMLSKYAPERIEEFNEFAPAPKEEEDKIKIYYLNYDGKLC